MNSGLAGPSKDRRTEMCSIGIAHLDGGPFAGLMGDDSHDLRRTLEGSLSHAARHSLIKNRISSLSWFAEPGAAGCKQLTPERGQRTLSARWRADLTTGNRSVVGLVTSPSRHSIYDFAAGLPSAASSISKLSAVTAPKRRIRRTLTRTRSPGFLSQRAKRMSAILLIA